jgi:hypothetical protein
METKSSRYSNSMDKKSLTSACWIGCKIHFKTRNKGNSTKLQNCRKVSKTFALLQLQRLDQYCKEEVREFGKVC